jgi:hypothetical protein
MPFHEAFDPPSMGPHSALGGMASGHLEPELQPITIQAASAASPGLIQTFSVAVGARVNDR